MKLRARSAVAVLALSVALGGARAGEEPPAPAAAERICDKTFKMVAPDKEQEQLGTYRLRAELKDGGKRVEIVEQVALDAAGVKLEYKSVVSYALSPAAAPAPLEASVETRLGGKLCMQGALKFGEKTVAVSCTVQGLGGDQAPRRTGREEKLPAGAVVFQSALPAIGPRFLAPDAERAEIVFVEFPDDVDGLVNFKEGYRLVRDKAGDNGQYDIRVLAKPSTAAVPERVIAEAVFDRGGRLSGIPSFWKFKLVAAGPDAPRP